MLWVPFGQYPVVQWYQMILRTISKLFPVVYNANFPPLLQKASSLPSPTQLITRGRGETDTSSGLFACQEKMLTHRNL